MWFKLGLNLFFQPAMFTAFVVLVNEFLRGYLGDFRSPMDAQALGSYVEVLGTFHAILAAFALQSAGNDIPLMQRCADEGNMLEFVRLRDKRIYKPVHLLLGFFSATVIFGACITYCYSELSTFFMVASASMSVSLYWKVAITLDNPRKYGWLESIDVPNPKFWSATPKEAIAWMKEHAPHVMTCWPHPPVDPAI